MKITLIPIEQAVGLPLAHDLTQIDATLGEHDWAFAREERAAIAAFWDKRQAGAPAMFDGRVLLQSEGHVEGGIFRARYFEEHFFASQHFFEVEF